MNDFSPNTTSARPMGRQSPARPDISVVVLTYNHARYIDQCLRSIVEQQTRFGLEVIVGEDGSDDGTADIVADYARSYPDVVKAFHRDRSNVVYVLGRPTGRYNMMSSLAEARGRYVALLDGDDFYTDARKLEIQATLLDDEPSINSCYHRWIRVDAEGNRIGSGGRRPKTRQLNAVGAASRVLSHIATHLVRNDVGALPSWFWQLPYGDWPFIVQMVGSGRVAYLPQAMSAHREHPGGVHTGDSEWHRLHMGLMTARIVRSSHGDRSVARAAGKPEFADLYGLYRYYNRIGKPRAARIAAHAAARLLLSGECPMSVSRLWHLASMFGPRGIPGRLDIARPAMNPTVLDGGEDLADCLGNGAAGKD